MNEIRCTTCHEQVPPQELLHTPHGHDFHRVCFAGLFAENINSANVHCSAEGCGERVYEYQLFDPIMDQEKHLSIRKLFTDALALDDPIPFIQFCNSDIARTLLDNQLDVHKFYSIGEAFQLGRLNFAQQLMEDDPELLRRLRQTFPDRVNAFIESLSEGVKNFLLPYLGD